MAQENFKVGDVVRLKSGGPRMTVTSTEGQNLECQWFDGGKPSFKTFPPGALKTVTSPLNEDI